MGTFKSRDIVEALIARNGEHHPGESERFDVVKIVQYMTPEGDPNNWGVVYRCEVPMGMGDRYEHAEACMFPKVIFTRKEPS